jgi:hypothetical protein
MQGRSAKRTAAILHHWKHQKKISVRDLWFTLQASVKNQQRISGSKIFSLGKVDDKVWHSLNHIGTVLFSYWANGERLTYNGFKDNYNNKVYSSVLCAAFQ